MRVRQQRQCPCRRRDATHAARCRAQSAFPRPSAKYACSDEPLSAGRPFRSRRPALSLDCLRTSSKVPQRWRGNTFWQPCAMRRDAAKTASSATMSIANSGFRRFSFRPGRTQPSQQGYLHCPSSRIRPHHLYSCQDAGLFHRLLLTYSRKSSSVYSSRLRGWASRTSSGSSTQISAPQRLFRGANSLVSRPDWTILLPA